MITSFKKTLSLLSRKERKRGVGVLTLVVVMAILETVGVASVMPFLSVLGDPSLIESDERLAWLYSALEFESSDRFLIFLGGLSFGLIAFSAVFKIFTYYILNHYTHLRRHSIGKRLLDSYIRQPYPFFLQRHSSDMAKAILSEVDQIITYVFKPSMNAIAYSIVILAIVSLLIVVNPMLALMAGLAIGGSYVLVFTIVQRYLKRIGRERATTNKQRFKATDDCLSGIKSIKLLGRESFYLKQFEKPSKRFSKLQALNGVLSEVPKFAVEIVAFGGVIALSLYLMLTSSNFGEVLPLLGLYALAGLKLLPAAQKVYMGLAKLRFASAAVDDVYDDLMLAEGTMEVAKSDTRNPRRFEESITLNSVEFKYTGSQSPSIDGVSFEILRGQSIGVVGGTGAGKTTVVDLILGLLLPSNGSIKIDQVDLQPTDIRDWQANIGYVPQDIFLFDASIAENIAIGEERDRIDMNRVIRAAKLAKLHDFIEASLPEGYETFVGERGARLSGGQRQRIGIARALYGEPEVIIFDEATSALDNETERELMKEISALSGEQTLIMVAHRLSTVQSCDTIVLMERGKIKAAGSYNELLENSPEFRALALGKD